MRIPKYRRHSTGQATLHLNGRDHYLGKYDSPESQAKYRALLADYLSTTGEPTARRVYLTIRQLAARYLEHARDYYLESNEAHTLEESRGIHVCLLPAEQKNTDRGERKRSLIGPDAKRPDRADT